MRVVSHPPVARLAPFVREFTFVETEEEATRLLMPDTGLIVGFRYGGSAAQLNGTTRVLPDATIAGYQLTARRIRTSAGGGVILAMFREGGASRFFDVPLHDLSGQTFALDTLLPHSEVDRMLTRIAEASGHKECVAIFEEFLLRREASRDLDARVAAAMRAIRRTRGSLRIGALARDLGLSQDALEKRFRHAIGASPKRLATMMRLRQAVQAVQAGANFTTASIAAGYFDQSHFNRDFRAVMGAAPRQFFQDTEYCLASSGHDSTAE